VLASREGGPPHPRLHESSLFLFVGEKKKERGEKGEGGEGNFSTVLLPGLIAVRHHFLERKKEGGKKKEGGGGR